LEKLLLVMEKEAQRLERRPLNQRRRPWTVKKSARPQALKDDDDEPNHALAMVREMIEEEKKREQPEAHEFKNSRQDQPVQGPSNEENSTPSNASLRTPAKSAGHESVKVTIPRTSSRSSRQLTVVVTENGQSVHSPLVASITADENRYGALEDSSFVPGTQLDSEEHTGDGVRVDATQETAVGGGDDTGDDDDDEDCMAQKPKRVAEKEEIKEQSSIAASEDSPKAACDQSSETTVKLNSDPSKNQNAADQQTDAAEGTSGGPKSASMEADSKGTASSQAQQPQSDSKRHDLPSLSPVLSSANRKTLDGLDSADAKGLGEIAGILLSAIDKVQQLPLAKTAPRSSLPLPDQVQSDHKALGRYSLKIRNCYAVMAGKRATKGHWRPSAIKNNLKEAARFLADLERGPVQEAARDQAARSVLDRSSRNAAWARDKVNNAAFWGGVDVITNWRRQPENPLTDINFTMIQVEADGTPIHSRLDFDAKRRKQCFMFYTRMTPESNKPCHWEPVGCREAGGVMKFLFDSPSEVPADEYEDREKDSDLKFAVAACQRRVIEENRAPAVMLARWASTFYRGEDEEGAKALRFRCAGTLTDGSCWFDSWARILPDWPIADQKKLLLARLNDRSGAAELIRDLRLGDQVEDRWLQSDTMKNKLDTSSSSLTAAARQKSGEAKQKPQEEKQKQRGAPPAPAATSTVRAASAKPPARAEAKSDSRTNISTLVADENKVIAWGIPKSKSVEELMRYAASKRIMIPRPTAVRVCIEFRQDRHHHILIFNGPEEAKRVCDLAAQLEQLCGWRVAAFRSRASRLNAGKELISEALTATREPNPSTSTVASVASSTAAAHAPMKSAQQGARTVTYSDNSADQEEQSSDTLLKVLTVALKKLTASLKCTEEVTSQPRLTVSVDSDPDSGAAVQGQQSDGRPPQRESSTTEFPPQRFPIPCPQEQPRFAPTGPWFNGQHFPFYPVPGAVAYGSNGAGAKWCRYGQYCGQSGCPYMHPRVGPCF